MVPYAVVRANNLPLDALDALTGSAPVEPAAAALGRQEAALARLAQAACDRLHALAASDAERYRRYIELRRAIHNGKALADVVRRHGDLLDGDALLRQWREQASTVQAGEAALALLFQRQLAAARASAQELVGEPSFLQAMAMTRAQLHDMALAYAKATDFSDKKALNDEETVHRYLTRALVKVSPFSTFTSVGFAPLGDAPGGSLLGGRATGGRYSLDRAGFFKLYDRFVLRHREHCRFRLTANRASRADGQYAYLFADQPAYYAHRTTFSTARLKSTAMLTEGADAQGWLPWSTLAQRLPAGADAVALLEKWLTSGLLQAAPALDDEGGDLLDQFRVIARRVAGDEPAARQVVQVLDDMAAVVASLDGLAGAALLAALARVHAGMARLGQLLDCPLVKTAGLVYHDSSLPDLAPLDGAELARYAGQVGEFVAHYLGVNFHSGFDDAQLAALRSALPPDTAVDVFAFHELMQGCQPGAHEPSRAALPILALYRQIWARRGEPEIVLEPVAAAPAGPLAAYGHLCGDCFVLNNIDSGYLRCFSRFFTFAGGDAVLAACRASYGKALAESYDFYDTFGFNTAQRPRLCGRRIHTGAAGVPRPDDLALADLAVDWPADAAYPRVLNRHTGAVLALRQSGLFTRELYPKLLEQLLQLGMAHAPRYFAFRFGVHQIVSDAAITDVTRIARVRYRDLVLSREQWWVPKARLPVRAAGEEAFAWFRRLDAWRRGHGIPQRAFVRRHDAALVLERDVSNAKKPLFVDFSAPLMARMIGRIFNTAFAMLSIEEMLPDATDERARHDGRRYAHEVLFESTDQPGDMP
ncbi:lantibiotic dehydratase [[Empedobacter] haloabium]|uniref:Lantibiotic dehydratase n=1 Tax=[Empedobacter] haloabium TaxID=592317 RepID=A0ABZ1UW69_9BURK